MRKVLLLYNPVGGRAPKRRLADVETVQSILRAAGVEPSVAPTRAAAAASDQVKQAIAEGCDAVFACGGDGTVHDVLQGLAGTNVALGVIPFGTANALAHDLGLPLSPQGAARALLAAKPRRIALGQIEYTDFTGNRCARYFAVAAGIGVDAQLFYDLNAVSKRRLGMAAYYAVATRLWLTHKMDLFPVEISAGDETRHVQVSELLAVRICDFGGVLRKLAPGASLERNDLRVVLFKTRSHLAYLRYVVRGLLGTRWRVPGIELLDSSGVACQSVGHAVAESSRIFVEADGELLGTLPAQISVVPDALSILAPSS